MIQKPIGSKVLFVDAHTRSPNFTLETANVREFSRVPELLVENFSLVDTNILIYTDEAAIPEKQKSEL